MKDIPNSQCPVRAFDKVITKAEIWLFGVFAYDCHVLDFGLEDRET